MVMHPQNNAGSFVPAQTHQKGEVGSPQEMHDQRQLQRDKMPVSSPSQKEQRHQYANNPQGTLQQTHDAYPISSQQKQSSGPITSMPYEEQFNPQNPESRGHPNVTPSPPLEQNESTSYGPTQSIPSHTYPPAPPPSPENNILNPGAAPTEANAPRLQQQTTAPINAHSSQEAHMQSSSNLPTYNGTVSEGPVVIQMQPPTNTDAQGGLKFDDDKISQLSDISDDGKTKKSIGQKLAKYVCCAKLPPALKLLLRLLAIVMFFFLPSIIILIFNGGFDYDIFLPRGHEPLTLLTEVVRYLIVIGCILSIRELSLFITEKILLLGHRVGRNKTRFADYMYGVRKYWAMFIFWIVSFFVISVFVFDQTAVGRSGLSPITVVVPPPFAYQDPKPPSGASAATDSAAASYQWVYYLRAAIQVMWLFSLFSALEKTFIQLLSASFHQASFEKRYAESSKKFSYLDEILRYTAGSPILSPIFEKMGLFPDEDLANKGNFEWSASAEELTKLSKTVYSDSRAKHNAKLIFNLLSNRGRSFSVEALRPYFSSKNNYKIVFNQLFSEEQIMSELPDSVQGSPGDSDSPHSVVTYKQCLARIRDVFKDRRDLLASIQSHGQIVNQFDSVLMVLVVLITVLVGIPFFGLNSPMSYFATMGSFLLGFTFVFGGFAKSIFEALVFLFVTHAYDIGDTLSLDNTELIVVTKIDLLTTHAYRVADNQFVSIPTASMIPKTIYNVSRSGFQTIYMDLMISSATPVEKIYELRSQVTNALLAEYPTEFTGKTNISGFDISDDAKKMKIIFSVEHASNFTDLTKKNKRNNQIKFKVKSVLESLNITYYSL